MEDNFVLNRVLVLCGIALLPVILWFIRKKWTKNILLFGLIFFLAFSQGTLELIGVSKSLIRLVFEVLIILVLSKSVLFNKGQKKILPGLFWFFLFIIVSLLSVILNEISVMNFGLFLREYLMIFLFFYGVVNLKLSMYENYIIKRLIIYLFLSQILANIIKFLILQDIVEPYIGTMANLGGSLTITFSLIGSAYSFAAFFVSKNRGYLMFSLAFILFALLGGKRAVIVFIPLVYLFLTYIYQKKLETKKVKGIGRIVFFAILSLGIFYFSVRLMPSLNKERKVWGSFDISYALDYSESYVTTGVGGIAEVGRAEAPGYLIALMINDNPYNLVLGYGAGHLIKSKYNSRMQKLGSLQELTNSLYGVGYAARTAFLQLLLQVGFLGLVVFLLFLMSIYRYTKKKYISNNLSKIGIIEYIFMLGLWLIFLLDFFTYSMTVIKITSVSIVLFWFFGHFSNEIMLKNEIIKK